MNINRTGTNLQPVEHIFCDGSGEKFRTALSASFLFASTIAQIANEKRPNHGLELWDQAIQYWLAKANQEVNLFSDDASFILEKQNNIEVWQYGVSITISSAKQRLWTLPDGIIKTPREIIALEFDHGENIGRWANQLTKAVRSLASKQINGVLYCFCMEKDLSPSGHLFTEQNNFSDEFLLLLQASIFEKKLGMITLFPKEWCIESTNEREEIIDFFESTYIEKNVGTKSKSVAREILVQLKRDAQSRVQSTPFGAGGVS